MRTKIAATWIVAHERGKHALIRDGEVVFEGNKLLHVGKGFEGRVGQDHRCDGQARRARLHRHARALRPPRLPPADHRHRPADVLRPALPRHHRAQGRQGGQGRSAVPQARRCRLRPRHSSSTPRSRSPSCCATASRRSSSTAASCSVQEALLPEVERLGHPRLSRRPATTAGAGWAARRDGSSACATRRPAARDSRPRSPGS